MGLSYVRGRDLARRRARFAAITIGEQLLLVTSLVVATAIAMAFQGRTRADAWASAGQPAPLNLNGGVTAEALEPVLAPVISIPADRRAAAQAITKSLGAGDERRELPNVGALARTAGISTTDLAALKPSLSVRTAAEFGSAVFWCAIAFIAAFQLVSLVWRWQGVAGDRVLLAAVHLLAGIGFVVMLTRPDPLRDMLLVVRYTQGIVIGLALFAAVSLIDIQRAVFRELSYVPLLGAILLSILLLVFGTGPGSSQAKVNLGPVQPIEAIRLLLALFLAGYFARRWEFLRQPNLPRLHHVLPVVAGVGTALVLFFFQKDLGPALLLSLMFLSMFAVARGGAWLAGAGFAGLVAGFGVGYLLNISSTLAARLQMWRSPWDNAVRGGDQVAQGLWAMAAGASSGTGLGLGHSRFVPEGHTDLVLAAVGEELGLVGLLVVAAAFAIVMWRGYQIARRASSDYQFFLALAMTLSISIPVLVMAGGLLGVLPLTGVVTPFLSYGGSAMAANFVALGLLVAIANQQRPVADLAPFHVPLRWLARAAGACAAALVIVCVNVQALRADAYLVRPQLSVQADGGRRFQYNPRVFEAMRLVPRGTVYDRRGEALATSDPEIAKRHADACPNPAERCYLAGPSLFHVLGNANTRLNWSAGNTSYVERDAEDRLRGFDDHAIAVPTSDRNGTPSLAIRRDYSAVVPLVRHRYEPDHPAVKAFLTQSRDVRITIDARLQQAVAGILARAARTPGVGKGAVVVLDADTGALLASVSYPWPGEAPLAGEDPATDAALDRARYGLYPPGSTFKMVTAAAALREGPEFAARNFVCQRLPLNRIGVRIPGFGPAIHDDTKDTTPHGELDMHGAIVRSCNAYFAQMAVALGTDALARTASTAGITLNASRSADRVRANLPHAGYGQGEVVATPLRLARVAAAIGTDGRIREMPMTSDARPIETTFVPPPAAHTLAGYLRDAVLTGTGRLLKDHPARIAGKTGTAEVDEAASHAWFAGFAPYGPATRRIAFAVVLEHAGYGGIAAANVAGQVASAAASMGLLK